MSDFHFKDDDDDLSSIPSINEAPAASPKAADVAKTVAAPNAPSPQVPLPKVPLPKVPLAPAIAARSTSAPSPPLPVAPAATRQAARPAANAVAPSAAVVPTSAAASRATSSTGTPAATRPMPAATPQVSKTAAPNVAAPKVPTPVAKTGAPSPKTPSAHPKAPTLPPLTERELGGELERRQMTLTAKPVYENVHTPILDRVLDFLTPVAFWLIRAAVGFGGLALVYLVYAFASGALTQGGEQPRIIANVAIAAGVLRWALLGATLSFFIMMWDERAVGIVAVAAGLALYFGAAPLLGAAGHTTAIGTLAVVLGKGGRALAGFGLAKCAYDLVAWVITLPERMRVRADVGVSQQAEPSQQRTAQNATMFSPCWKLPFCREVIRKQCPAYLAKTTCWKFGRGCYCDEEMISRIIRGESLDAVKAPTRMSMQGKPPCHRCYIFLEHQGLKYRVFSPLAVPATIGTMYFGWPVYMALTGKIGSSLQWMWDRLAFHGSTTATDVVAKISDQASKAPSTLSPAQVQQAAQTMCGVLLGFYLLILLSKGIEWAIYKARL